MRVQHYQRKRRAHANFSLEYIFQDIRDRCADKLAIELVLSPFLSNGILRRICIMLHAWWCQRGIVHVTGDINYAAMFLDPRKSVLTVLDCGFLAHAKPLHRAILKKLWLDWPVSRMQNITTISEFSKQEIVRLTQCDANKIRVIPVAISERFVRQERLFNSAKPRFLVVGTAKNKNISRIAMALKDIPCELLIIGLPSFEDLALLDSIAIGYKFKHDLTIDEVVECYCSCDALLFPSTYEGFGMPILEAQATGRVVVTSQAASMPDVSGGAACLVDPKSVESIRSGVLRVIEDQVYREQLIAAGFVNVQRFKPGVIADQYLNLYREIASC